MPAPPSPASLEEELRAALDWWREAGVDQDFAEDATAWLADDQGNAAVSSQDVHDEPAAPAPAAAPSIGGERTGWPQDLSSFRDWWLAEPSLDGGGTHPRVGPRGVAEARLLVLVGEPEADDRETLLSGPQGRLLDAMLAAMELDGAETYRASALPRHTPLADWHRIAAKGMSDVLAHHLALARPRRILAFGRNILPLFAHDAAQGAASSFSFNHEGLTVPVMAAEGLETLLSMASARARFWRRWLEWTDGDTWQDEPQGTSPQG